MLTIIERREIDNDALRYLFLKERQNTFTWLDTSSFRLSDFEEETEDEYILVAFEENTVIGFISVWKEDNFIHHLYIDEKHQNNGIGSKLLEAVIEELGLPIRLKCLSNNVNAIEFYRKKGFKEKGKGATENGTYILFELT
ncbi:MULTISPECIES: GNAT family N-acetyltransferase [unclassified Arcicella]|uniref:GNAT family N-acetyltransferase n=1 Tax=unclassified Arcicella TaxID=2644986 RepID=UPI00286047A6|nr:MULTISPECIES: GNAT family N-acetyltransferase [unclassified Arcicella]MDR6563247.1 ribosomal protein S18 acetylase RimI-like enzyme [Arcicella sp. BE51]MDR6811602.1 ribosomal protein S18 acetylase RimI-like enzyme [Arcicella sp. BE140]MDR6823128.1 ribosomal protein S18 acetylase RimI-like enzyme [Arcicella sp. BE139]